MNYIKFWTFIVTDHNYKIANHPQYLRLDVVNIIKILGKIQFEREKKIMDKKI